MEFLVLCVTSKCWMSLGLCFPVTFVMSEIMCCIEWKGSLTDGWLFYPTVSVGRQGYHPFSFQSLHECSTGKVFTAVNVYK